MSWRWWVVGAVVALGVVAGIGWAVTEGRDATSGGPTSTEAALPAVPTDVDLARVVGCEITHDFGEDVPGDAPVRGGAATDGVACSLDGAEVHLFVRARGQSGSLEDIDARVGTGIEDDCTAWVAVGETWFALAGDREVLATVADDLGGSVREILPTGPPDSYTPPCTVSGGPP